MPKLYAISDLHIEVAVNRDALERLPRYPKDWLILAGDIANTYASLKAALELLNTKFKQLIWVPGNHELWNEDNGNSDLKGVKKYDALVELCRSLNVITPEDPYPVWESKSADGNNTNYTNYVIAPLFLLYDYSFRPDHVSREGALKWAAEMKIGCTDEHRLNPAPFKTRDDWCESRLRYTETRLLEAQEKGPFILINHYPLRQEFIRFKRIERFSLWCGTRATHDWHTKYPTHVAVSGHLHMRATDYRDGVRFEEVSLGYAKHWHHDKGIEGYLREILPGPSKKLQDHGPTWHF